MCAIVGSRSLETLKELVAINSYRGSHSYSLSTYNTYTGILTVSRKKLGTIDLSKFSIAPNEYAIVHVQAPTTDSRTENFIHPAVLNINTHSDYNPDLALWHNGIIKADIVKNNVNRYHSSWDTMQILKALALSKSYNILNEFDGSFSCLMYSRADLSLKLFRNEISPMYVDDLLNISSTKFTGSTETTPNRVIKLSLAKNKLIMEDEFKTVENPYYFGE